MDSAKDNEIARLRKQVADKKAQDAKKAELRRLEDELASIKGGRRGEPSYLLMMLWDLKPKFILILSNLGINEIIINFFNE